MIGTKRAAEILGVRPSALTRAIWDDRFPAPERGPGHAYIWTEDDLRRAAHAMRGKSLDQILAERERKGGEE